MERNENAKKKRKPGKGGVVLPDSPGRPKGSKNKLGQEVKAMVFNALYNAGGEEYLTGQARENPQAFLTLLGKCLPKDVDVDHGGNVTVTLRREVLSVSYDGA